SGANPGAGSGSLAASGMVGTVGASGIPAGDASDIPNSGADASGIAMSGVGTSGVMSSGASDLTNSVLERNKHPSRDGNFVQPMLTKAKAAAMAMEPNFKATFGGAMWASPLYLEDGPANKGLFFAATTSNTVYALDESTGAVVWMTPIGPPAAGPGVGCGDIHPIGILGTPVIDHATRTLYVVGNMGPGATTGFEAHALSVDDGKERTGWPVSISKVTSGNLTFNAGAENQRGALSLVNGILYIPFGGHNGDCGPYHGWVVAIDTKAPTTVGAWATAGLGEAIWASGGMVSDGNGVIAVTGNSNAIGPQHMDSEEVVRLTGMATLNRSDANIYYPARWRALDAADDDFGASSPVLIHVPGPTSPSYVVATTKDGHTYFLDSQKLGGMDGHAAELVVAGVSHSARTAHASYATGMGVHVTLTVDDHAVCPTAQPGGPVLMSILVAPGPPIKPQTIWCKQVVGFIGTGGTHRTSAPIATTTDGTHEAVVWVVSGGALLGVDGDTGVQIYSGGACGNVRQWTSPIAVKGRIVVGGDGHLCSWAAP
ncbi:MAG TPA: hypothetical protein VGY54_15025, partial [Polyangiaceae bacterium]|nr:hypothetical protein [Polyangiaceae bacterium]